MALVGNDFYVANTDALLRFRYDTGATHIDGAGTKVADLPAGTINHHWTKNVIASRDGSRLYVTVGSNSNVAENGIDAEKDRAGDSGDRSDDRRDSASSRPACAIRTAWPGSRKPARCGRWSTSATSSAAISCRTT